MPKEKNEAQEAQITESSQNQSELESTQEAQEASQEQKKAKPTQTPKLKNAINKKTKLIDCLSYHYIGQEDFTLRVGSKVYVITQGEILIVPNGNTSRWLAHKSTLFTPVI